MGKDVGQVVYWLGKLKTKFYFNFTPSKLRYGCCPDGITHAKGPDNDGCGCVFSQYGCCPDGKNSAKGPGFYGTKISSIKFSKLLSRLPRKLCPK